jgi:hypothetical protein
MTAITVGTAASVPASKASANTSAKTSAKTSEPKKSLLARIFDAFIESRMRQAQREIAMHQHLLPGEFQLVGERLSPRTEKELPFVR